MSKLIYCITVWGFNLNKEELRKLQVLQNKILRLISGMDYDTPVPTLLKVCNELSVHQLIAYHTVCQVYKIQRTKEPMYHYNRLFGDQSEKQNRTKIRGSEMSAKQIEFDLSLARGSFFYQGSRIWNLLPHNIKISKNLRKFKINCKKWIQNNISIKP